LPDISNRPRSGSKVTEGVLGVSLIIIFSISVKQQQRINIEYSFHNDKSKGDVEKLSEN